MNCEGPCRVPLWRKVDGARRRGAPTTPMAGEALFCLHPKRIQSPAGAVCSICGEVVTPTNDLADFGYRAVSQPVPLQLDGAHREWQLQTSAIVHSQPEEILRNAQKLFFSVCMKKGVITGRNARALVLVCMLFELRRFSAESDTEPQEAQLIQCLSVPNRCMNKAFGALVDVLHD